MKKLKMRGGNINRLLVYLSTKHDRFIARGATEAQVKTLRETIDLLERFSKTKAGFAWDQQPLELALLQACYDEMARHGFK